MTRSKARLAGVLFPLLLIVVAYVFLVPRNEGGGTQVRAEFQNAGVLAPGHDVRIRGAKVGSVRSTELTDRGTALVTMRLFDGVTPPRADATVSIRPADFLGDVYLSLQRGEAAHPLRAPIPSRRTFLATGLQDVFDTFDRPTRTALQVTLVELGRSLDARGVDLNEATLRLAPALRSLRRVSRQLGGQRAQLNRLIDNTEAVGADLAPRTRDLERLIDGLDATLGITAARTVPLRAGLRQLPATLGETRATLAALERTATGLRPLAVQLGQMAAPLAATIRAAGPFLRQARTAVVRLDPLLRHTRRTLRSGRRSLPHVRTTLTKLEQSTPQLTALSTIVTPVVDKGIKGIFDGLGGLAAEPGAQGRNQFRGEIVLGCEMFGIPTRPGCLADGALSLSDLPVRRRSRDRDRARGNGLSAPSPGRRPSTRAPQTPEGVRPPSAGAPEKPVPAVPQLIEPGKPPTEELGDRAESLLDYLLAP